MLTTDKRSASLQNINIRTQKHGKQKVRAMDLKFSFQMSSEELDGILPGLKEMLYRKPTAEGDQLEISPEAAGSYTVLRNPDLEPIKIKGKFPGYEVTVHEQVPLGVLPESNGLFLIDASLHGLTVDAHEGGTADIIVTAAIPFDTQELADASEYLVEDEVLLSLTPPHAQAQQMPKPGVDLEPEVASDAISTADAAAAAIAADEAGKALH